MTCGPRVIELVGAPGTGKSSVASALGKLPGVVVLKDHRARDLPALVWSAAAVGRSLFAPLPRGVSRSRWIAWLGRSRAAPRLVRRRFATGAGTVVLDQGPAYTLGRIAVAAGRDPTVARWYDRQLAQCGGLLDAVVLLDGDPALLAERLHSRAKRHDADDLLTAAAVAYLEREAATSRRIADTLAAAGVARLDLDAARPLADNVAAVRALLGVEAAPA